MVAWLEGWPPLRRVLTVTLAFLLGAQLVSAFTIGDDDSDTAVATEGSTTSTSLGDTSTTNDNESSTSVAPTTVAPRSGSAPTTVPASVGFAGPQHGEYTYRVESKSTEDGETDEEKYDAYLLVTDVGGGKKRHRFVEQGEVTEADDMVWRADGRYVVATDGSGNGSPDCDLEPDLRTAPAPATTGMTWTFKSSCSVRDPNDPEPYTVNLSGTAKVVGTERRTVSGQSLDVVHFHVDIADDDPSDGPDATSIEEFYAPSVGLTIEETDHSSGSGEYEDGQKYSYDDLNTRRLASLTPG